MVLATRGRTRAVLVLLVLTAVAAAWDGVSWWRAAQLNVQIAAGEPPPEAAGQPVELRFAQAAAQAASGARDAALNRYRALQTDPRVGPAARYNSANLLMQQAVQVRASTQPGQAIALIELAKEYYRDVLRGDGRNDSPAPWDARYNLERAQRLLPDPEEEEAAQADQSRNRERAVTTMRGYSPGLP